MHSLRINLLATLLFLAHTAVAMEDHGTQPQGAHLQPVITVQDVLGMACSQPERLTRENLVEYATLVDQTEQFKLLASEERPVQLKMLIEDLSETTDNTRAILAQQYRKTWAPRTGIAAGACCLLTCIKPYLCGLLDALPTHEVTILLSGFWAAEVKERQPERNCIDNGSTVLKIIESKSNTLIKSRIKELQKRKKDSAQKVAQQATEEDPQTQAGNAETVSEETKKDK